MDPSYSIDLSSPSSEAALALADFNSLVSADCHLTPTSEREKFTQKGMSKSIDEKTFSAIKQQPPPRGDNNYHTHLELTSAKGAGTWLHATPTTNLGTQMDPMLSRTAILQWIRAPLAPNDTTCHRCSGVLDALDATTTYAITPTTTPPVPASTQSSNDQAYFNPGL